jgi:mevalonate kinase
MSAPHSGVERSACAKVILCGEHAVVYGRPAIALPLPRLRAFAHLQPSPDPFKIVAPDVGVSFYLSQHSPQTRDPLARVAWATLNWLGKQPPQATLMIQSDIPIGANLGSSAAVSVAMIRALAAWFGRDLLPAEVSALAYEGEQLYHGSPSGIDNTVIAYEQPVWFVRGAPPEVFDMSAGLPLVIADAGVATPTHIPVGAVRAGWESDRAGYEARFDAIAALVVAARQAIQDADLVQLGRLMDQNHAYLQQLGVSSPELDALCAAARAAGALGAKMSGGGRGGNMIALASDAVHAQRLAQALRDAGSKRVLLTC